MAKSAIFCVFFLYFSFNIYAQCPWVQGVLVNACSSNEGLNEMVNFKTGSSTLLINSLGMTFATAGNWCNSGCGVNTWANGATYFNSSVRNDCTATGVFINVNNTSGSIPPNSQVLVFTSQNPSFDYDLSSLCNLGPFYVVFANNASTGGRFSNTATTLRNITLTDNGSCSQTVSYLASGNLSNTDGDYVRYDQSGNPTYTNLSSCVYTPNAFNPLPESLIQIVLFQNTFSLELKATGNLEKWVSEDGIQFRKANSTAIRFPCKYILEWDEDTQDEFIYFNFVSNGFETKSTIFKKKRGQKALTYWIHDRKLIIENLDVTQKDFLKFLRMDGAEITSFEMQKVEENQFKIHLENFSSGCYTFVFTGPDPMVSRFCLN